MKLNHRFSSRLRHLIEFMINRSVNDLEPDNWEVIHSAYSQIMALSETNVREFDDINFGHILSEEYYVITCRFIRNINTKMRIKFGERIFSIKRVINPLQLSHVLKIIALEITE